MLRCYWHDEVRISGAPHWTVRYAALLEWQKVRDKL